MLRLVTRYFNMYSFSNSLLLFQQTFNFWVGFWQLTGFMFYNIAEVGSSTLGAPEQVISKMALWLMVHGFPVVLLLISLTLQLFKFMYVCGIWQGHMLCFPLRWHKKEAQLRKMSHVANDVFLNILHFQFISSMTWWSWITLQQLQVQQRYWKFVCLCSCLCATALLIS